MNIFTKLAATLLLALPCALSAGDYLKISDFEGRYVGWGYSVGGYSGPSAGTSQANIFQQFIDKHGNGRIDFISYNVFGSVCSVSTTTPPTLPVITYCNLPSCDSAAGPGDCPGGTGATGCALACSPIASTVGTTQVNTTGTLNMTASPFFFKIKIFNGDLGAFTVNVTGFPFAGVTFTNDAVCIVKDCQVQESYLTYPTGTIKFGNGTAMSTFSAFFGTTNTSIGFTKRQ